MGIHGCLSGALRRFCAAIILSERRTERTVEPRQRRRPVQQHSLSSSLPRPAPQPEVFRGLHGYWATYLQAQSFPDARCRVGQGWPLQSTDSRAVAGAHQPRTDGPTTKRTVRETVSRRGIVSGDQETLTAHVLVTCGPTKA